MKIFKTFNRSDKTDCIVGWPDDVDKTETNVDELKKICIDLQKKMLSGLSSGSATDHDKKLKKIPYSPIAATLHESGTHLEPTNPLLSGVMTKTGEIVGSLAQATLDMEIKIERETATELKRISEEDCHLLQKQKKQLNRLVVEAKTARDRQQALQESLGSMASGNASLSAAGVSIPDRPGVDNQKVLRLTQAESVVAQTQLEEDTGRDEILRGYYQFESKTTKYAENMVTYLQELSHYHRNCLDILENGIPEVLKTIDDKRNRLCFKVPLEQHLSETKREIAFPLETCIKSLNNKHSISEQGLFRIAGSKKKVSMLKASMNLMRLDSKLLGLCDPTVIADVLKQYLRSLPDPLLTYDLYDSWINALRLNDAELCTEVNRLISCLPTANRNNLEYVIKFLSKVSKHESENKMSVRNLSIVFGPNLIKSRSTDTDPCNKSISSLGSMSDYLGATPENGVIELLIENADFFFPKELFKDFCSERLGEECGHEFQHNRRESTPNDPSASTVNRHQRNASQGSLDKTLTSHTPPTETKHTKLPNSSPGDGTLKKRKAAAPKPPKTVAMDANKQPPPLPAPLSTVAMDANKQPPPLPAPLSTVAMDANKQPPLPAPLSTVAMDANKQPPLPAPLSAVAMDANKQQPSLPASLSTVAMDANKQQPTLRSPLSTVAMDANKQQPTLRSPLSAVAMDANKQPLHLPGDVSTPEKHKRTIATSKQPSQQTETVASTDDAPAEVVSMTFGDTSEVGSSHKDQILSKTEPPSRPSKEDAPSTIRRMESLTRPGVSKTGPAVPTRPASVVGSQPWGSAPSTNDVQNKNRTIPFVSGNPKRSGGPRVLPDLLSSSVRSTRLPSPPSAHTDDAPTLSDEDVSRTHMKPPPSFSHPARPSKGPITSIPSEDLQDTYL